MQIRKVNMRKCRGLHLYLLFSYFSAIFILHPIFSQLADKSRCQYMYLVEVWTLDICKGKGE